MRLALDFLTSPVCLALTLGYLAILGASWALFVAAARGDRRHGTVAHQRPDVATSNLVAFRAEARAVGIVSRPHTDRWADAT